MSEIIAEKKELMTLPRLNILSEWMVVSQLDGSQGANREINHSSQINAQNDYQAIQCWLAEYQHKETTHRTYQKEVERFLLWCLIQIKKPLSSIDRDDIETYVQFLNDPQPHEFWCGKKGGRKHHRGEAGWKPFAGSLSQNTIMTSLSIIESLFSYLTDGRYLAFNPFSLIRKRKFARTAKQEHAFKIQERILEVDEWDAMIDTLEGLPNNKPKEKERLRFLVLILFFLGLRINELETHTWNSFRKIDDRWWFFVKGKGDKFAKIPVNDQLLKAVIHYRNILELPPFPENDERRPLISKIDDITKPITARQMNKLLKELALETAKEFTHQPEKEKKLKRFSAHWLRHLSASMQDRLGITFNHIRSNMRHENDHTTRLYVHAVDEERHHEMQKLKLRI